MYEELVKRLREEGNWLGFTDQLRNLFNNAADAIEERRSAVKKLLRIIGELETEIERLERERRWIPATERVPEKYHQVLVYGLNGMQIDYYAGEKSIGGRPLFMISEAKVTHWQPLPEPPKEE